MTHRARILSTVVALLALGVGVPFGVTACNPGGGDSALGESPRDAGIQILDAGFGLRDRTDAGLDAGPEPEPEADAGSLNYVGEAEPGVRCGETLEACPVGDDCCAQITDFETFESEGSCATNPAPPDAGPGNVCGPFEFPFACDDPSIDCGFGELCCFTFGFDPVSMGIALQTECRDYDSCFGEADSVVCSGESDCPPDTECCGGGGLALPLDFGLCLPSCELPTDAGM